MGQAWGLAKAGLASEGAPLQRTNVCWRGGEHEEQSRAFAVEGGRTGDVMAMAGGTEGCQWGNMGVHEV